MTKFENLQQLLDYCYKCPICSGKRKVTITAGPDEIVRRQQFSFIDKPFPLFTLTLDIPKKEQQSEWSHKLNYNKWSCAINMLTGLVGNGSDEPIDDLFFHFFASCSNSGCGRSYLNTNDIMVNWKTKQIENLGIEDEVRKIVYDTMRFELNYVYPNNQITVCRYERRGEEWDKNPGNVILPITDFDFTNPKQLIEKLKTLYFYY